MSSRSRRPAEQPDAPDPAEVERRAAAAKAFEQAGTKQGLSKWVGLALDERKRQLEPEPAGQYVAPDGTAFDIGSPAPEPRGLREPTPFERAILFGMGSKPMYAGTVDPEVVAQRRQRNKAARKARRRNRLAAAR